MLESLKGWIIDPNTQAQKTIENYENQRLSIEDAIESGLLNNRAGQIFLDYGDIVMGPAVKTPADIIVIRETVKGNSDSKEMQRTATAGFYAGFVGQGIEYTQIISNADYQLSMIITSAKGVNSINNPLSYLLCIKDFLLTQTIDAAKAGLQDAWNGTYDSAIGRKIGAGTFNYLLMTIGGAQLKGKGTACEAVESGSSSLQDIANKAAQEYNAKYNPYERAISKGYTDVKKTANGGVSFQGSEYMYYHNGQEARKVIQATGNRNNDFKMANQAMRLLETPDGYVWHHLDDYNVEKNTITMELVMDEAHNASKPHSGGCAQYDSVNGPTYNKKRR